MNFPVLTRLLARNAQWSADIKAEDPTFFILSAQGQFPKVLWIGCSDSRVPESVIMACRPGEIFTTRNIANQFHLDDDSVQSMLAYAVNVVGVEHIIICGHTGCGGIETAYQIACNQHASTISSLTSDPPAPITFLASDPPAPDTPLWRWLAPLVQLALDLKLPPKPPVDALPLLLLASVQTQIQNIQQAAVENHLMPKQTVYVHGWIYTLDTGLLQDLGVSTPLILF